MNTLNELYLNIENVFNTKKVENLSIIAIKELLLNYKGCDWQKYCSFSPEKYMRISLFRCGHFEVCLLCWGLNQGSLPHNHPKGGCIMKVLQGMLSEQYYSLDASEVFERNLLREGAISYIDDGYGLHSIQNIHAEPSISLHIYSPPGYTPKFYSVEQKIYA